MAKKRQEKLYALRQGHPQAFRRTVDLGDGKKVLLVFEPGKTYELSEIELPQCQDIVDGGLLMEVTFDDKGRLRYPNSKVISLGADEAIATLEAKIETLSSANAKLSAELAASTKSGKDDKTPNTDGK